MMIYEASEGKETLVTVLAEPLARLQKIKMIEDLADPLDDCADHVVEAFVQYTSSVLASSYIASTIAEPKVAAMMNRLKQPPTWGQWISLLVQLKGTFSAMVGPNDETVPDSVEDIVRALCAPVHSQEVHDYCQTVQAFLNAEDGVSMSSLKLNETVDLLKYFLFIRNRKRHGGTNWYVQIKRQVAVLYAKAVMALVFSMKWLFTYPLYFPAEIEPTGSTFLHKGLLFSGYTPLPNHKLELTFRLPADSLVFDPRGAAISLSPFYHVFLCKNPQCYGDRIFAFNKLIEKSKQLYVHPYCGQEIETSNFSEAWGRVFREREEKEGSRKGVECTATVEPSDRPIYCAEIISLRYRVENFSKHVIRNVSVDIELPKYFETVSQNVATKDRLSPGKYVDFEYNIRAFKLGKVVVPPSQIRYTLPDGRPVARQTPERLLPVIFNINPALVGRKRELDFLFGRLALSMTGTLQLIAISGRKGSGKRALMYAFLNDVEKKEGHEYVILRTKCLGDEQEPYANITDLLKRYMH